MADTWNGLVSTDVFRSNVYVDEDGSGRIDVLVDEYEGYRLDDLELPARFFVESLLASAREALRAAEQCVSGPLRPPSTDHLPLFGTVSEFFDFIERVQCQAFDLTRSN
jgi:glycine/D-amino acid oxidase-like deaminating enzyme